MRMGALIAVLTLVLGVGAREPPGVAKHDDPGTHQPATGVAIGLRAQPRMLANPFLLMAVTASLRWFWSAFTWRRCAIYSAPKH